MSHKTCGRCGRTLPLERFHRDAHAPDGYRPTCKECRNARVRVQQREYYRAHRDDALAYAKRKYKEGLKKKEEVNVAS